MRQRRLINALRFVLDELIPPFVRDNPVLMAMPLRLVFRSKAKFIKDFKRCAFFMTDDEMGRVYAEIRGLSPLFRGETDLNSKCLNRILADVAGCSSVLDVGCGTGFLANRLSAKVPEVTAADIYLDPEIPKRYPNVRFTTADLEHLDFPDSSFDVAIATHTLEHLRHPLRAVQEMRRVARYGIIIVVPRERPYRFTFNLHLQFFPYKESLLYAIGARSSYVCELLDGDFYFFEKVSEAAEG